MTRHLSNDVSNDPNSNSPQLSYRNFKPHDLVRLSNNHLAIIKRIPDDSSDEESDMSDSEEEDGQFVDSHGRLLINPDPYTHQYNTQMAILTAASQSDLTNGSNIPSVNPSIPSSITTTLITKYDDDNGDNKLPAAADTHENEQRHDQTHNPSISNSNRPSTYNTINNTLTGHDFLLPFQQQNLSPSFRYNVRHEIPEGSALVWVAMTGEEKIVSETELRLVDRPFEHSQIVCHKQISQSSMTGVIRSVQKTLVVRRIDHITSETTFNPDPDTCFEIPADQLRFFIGVSIGDSVVRRAWVGLVAFFQEEVLVQFEDDALASVPGDPSVLHNTDPRTPTRYRLDMVGDSLFYPGQKVAGLPNTWRDVAVWHRGGYAGKTSGIVKAVRVGHLGVQWAAKSMFTTSTEDLSINNMPLHKDSPQVVPLADVTQLESFTNSRWTVGDRGYIASEAKATRNAQNESQRGDTIPNQSDGTRVSGSTHCTTAEKNSQELTASDLNNNIATALRRALGQPCNKVPHRSERATDDDKRFLEGSVDPRSVVQVVETKTKVNIIWQDGTESEEVPSTSLRWANRTHDYLPGDLVRKSCECVNDSLDSDDDEDGLPQRYTDNRMGVVLRMDPKEKTATVRWHNDILMKFENDEEVSAYDLDNEDVNDIRIGDTVLHTPPEIYHNLDDRDEWVGVVLRKDFGKCTVAWNGGKVSEVPITQVILVEGQYESSYESDSSQDSDDSEEVLHSLDGDGSLHTNRLANISRRFQPNWGQEEDDNFMHLDTNTIGLQTLTNLINQFRDLRILDGNFSHDIVHASEEGLKVALDLKKSKLNNEANKNKSLSSSDAKTLTWVCFGNTITALTRKQFTGNQARESPSEDGNGEKQWEQLKKVLSDCVTRIMSIEGDEAEIQSEMDIDLTNDDSSQVPIPPFLKSDECTQAKLIEDEKESIDGFAVLNEFDGFHSFSNSSAQRQPPAGHLRIIQKEWCRLQKNLPPGIIVRGNESVKERIRAAIIGPEDTPYADVLFFFDILLGGSYPISPPNVWFHSHGRRLNPNLYEDGKVCLSILGTWDGDDVETWDPQTSNLLRVLLSLQAMVFVDEPYFNEAGYGKQRGTEEGTLNSRSYNENTFLLCMKHIMLTLTANEPKDCIKIARQHYRHAGERIIKRCKSFLQDQSRNCSDARADHDFIPKASSGFRKSIAQLIPALERQLLALIPAHRSCGKSSDRSHLAS